MPSLSLYDAHDERRDVRQVPRKEEGGARMICEHGKRHDGVHTCTCLCCLKERDYTEK